MLQYLALIVQNEYEKCQSSIFSLKYKAGSKKFLGKLQTI